MTEQENVLVIPTHLIPHIQGRQGISVFHDKNELDIFLRDGRMFFNPKDKMETDENFRQLIPYVVFVHGNQVYTYQRLKGEQRLNGKMSIGVGGHINFDDYGKDDPYTTGMLREIEEEVKIGCGVRSHRLIGFINDESTPVGRVHLGVLHIIELESTQVFSVDEAMKDVGFLSIETLSLGIGEYEVWSQMVIAFLHRNLTHWQGGLEWDLSQFGLEMSLEGIWTHRYPLNGNCSYEIISTGPVKITSVDQEENCEVVAADQNPDYPQYTWNEIQIVSGPGYEFGIIGQENGRIEIAVKKRGADWYPGKEPQDGLQYIKPGNAAYVVMSDWKHEQEQKRTAERDSTGPTT